MKRRPSTTSSGPGGTLDVFLDGLDDATQDSFLYPEGARHIRLQPFSITKTLAKETMTIVSGLVPGFMFTQEGGDIVYFFEDGTQTELKRPWTYVISLTPEAIAEAKAERGRFDLSFAGGTVSEYVSAIQEAADRKRIVLSPDASSMPVSEVRLTNITLGEAARLLEELAGVSVEYIQSVVLIRPGKNTQSVTEGGPVDSRAWSIETIVGPKLTVRDLLGAIDAAVDFGGGQSCVRFHRETGLLMARGPIGELELIENVLDRAAVSASARSHGIDYDELIERTEFELQNMRIEAEVKQEELQYAHQVVREMESGQEKGFASATQVQEARVELKKAEASLRKAELRVQELEKKLQAYSSKASQAKGEVNS